MFQNSFIKILIAVQLFGLTFAQQQTRSKPNGQIARQPAPPVRNPPQQQSTPLPTGCSQSKATGCLTNLMQLNISALIETFKEYELFSFDIIDETKLHQQARVTAETCRVFNLFNDCTGGDFLKCFDKKKLVDIIQGFASMSASRASNGNNQMNSVMNEIAGMINDKQIDFVGHALIDACRRIQRGEVKLAELALCIRKDKRLLDQLSSLAPQVDATTVTAPSANPLSLSTHCRVFRCDVSRLLIHMLVRSAESCSDESGARFIFWLGQVALTGIRNVAPDDVVIANGDFGTQTISESSDQCVVRDQDFNSMKTTPAKSFADLGISRASQLCAAEVATTTTMSNGVLIRYDVERPRDNYKVDIEATLDDLHNDMFWDTASANAPVSTMLLILPLLFIAYFL